MGFSKRFCKICEEVNRYSNSNPRERESDILELANHFGGMILDRPERIGFQVDDAIVLLEHRNLKDVYNRYLSLFIEYVREMENIELKDNESTGIKPLKKLVNIYNESEDLKEFTKKMANEYAPSVDKEVSKYNKNLGKDILGEMKYDPNRSLFSEETTKKIMGKISDNNILKNSINNE